MKLSQAIKDSLNELIAIAGDEISEVEVEKRLFGWRVRVSRGGSAPIVQTVAAAPAASAEASVLSPDADGKSHPGEAIVSPMVGTFYRAPSPDADPFVKEGDVVTAGQTVCIIEAMKIMNEIEAEVSGRVSKVLVENGAPVEYNTHLFLVDPS